MNFCYCIAERFLNLKKCVTITESWIVCVQVYASITPVVYLVNVSSESGGVTSLANITVRVPFAEHRCLT